jgi:transposase
MTMLPAGVKVHLAFGYTDMRKGMDGLALLVQEALHQDPFSGHLFVFRGRKAILVKVVYWDRTGSCLFIKRLEQGPVAAGHRTGPNAGTPLGDLGRTAPSIPTPTDRKQVLEHPPIEPGIP